MEFSKEFLEGKKSLSKSSQDKDAEVEEVRASSGVNNVLAM